MTAHKLSDRIKLAMAKNGIEANLDLIRKAEVSEGAFYKWLRDEEIPRGSSRYKLAKALGVDPEWLRTGEGDMEPKPSALPLLDLCAAHQSIREGRQRVEAIRTEVSAGTQELLTLALTVVLDVAREHNVVIPPAKQSAIAVALAVQSGQGDASALNRRHVWNLINIALS